MGFYLLVFVRVGPLHSNCMDYGVALLGDYQAGKTMLRKRLQRRPEPFADKHTPTIGADFAVFDEEGLGGGDDGDGGHQQLWDMAGASRFRPIVRNYRRRWSVCVLVFDVTCRASFDYLLATALNLFQLRKCDRAAPSPEAPPCVVIVVGAKIDLVGTAEEDGAESGEPRAHRREVTREEAERVAFGELDADAYVEVSAKTGEGVEYLRRVIRRCAPQPRSRVGAVKLPVPAAFV